MKENNNSYVSIQEACKMLGGLNRSTLHRWIKSGILKAYKAGSRTLIKIEDLDNLITPI